MPKSKVLHDIYINGQLCCDTFIEFLLCVCVLAVKGTGFAFEIQAVFFLKNTCGSHIGNERFALYTDGHARAQIYTHSHTHTQERNLATNQMLEAGKVTRLQ